ncbi:hypothetical protein L208DRAFT_1392361 [Tricholoma matsutake]|nr:hypothetical protein L208DRAFT_1392361 [Tricholoma matsutake 945]
MFKLDASGVAATLFGGDESVSAQSTIYTVSQSRRWLGWYNSPGSYALAKRYRELAQTYRSKATSSSSGTFASSTHVDLATMSGSGGNTGLSFVGTHSGTRISNTRYTGYLFLKKCQSLSTTKVIQGRITSPITLTIAELSTVPHPETDVVSPPQSFYDTLLATIPILSSIGACALCAIYKDWYSFSMILLGILSTGISNLILGSCTLRFQHPIPAGGSPKGDGFLQSSSSSSELVVLRGEEGAVNAVTRGGFSLNFTEGEPSYERSAVLFTVQSLLQVLLIPQGTLFGQILFLSTLAISWGYNWYLSSVDQEMKQADILVEMLGNPVMKRYRLGTWTAGVVFLVLALRPPEPGMVFDQLLPDTATWKVWKRVVAEKVARGEKLVFGEHDFDGASYEGKVLLRILFGDAEDAYDGYLDFEGREGGFSDGDDSALKEM